MMQRRILLPPKNACLLTSFLLAVRNKMKEDIENLEEHLAKYGFQRQKGINLLHTRF